LKIAGAGATGRNPKKIKQPVWGGIMFQGEREGEGVGEGKRRRRNQEKANRPVVVFGKTFHLYLALFWGKKAGSSRKKRGAGGKGGGSDPCCSHVLKGMLGAGGIR